MLRTSILLSATISLSACSGDATIAELEPGRWQISTELMDIDVPGASPEQLVAFEEAVGTKSSQELCFTAEEAVLNAETLSGAFPHDDNCQTSDFKITGDSLSGEMICKLPDGDELSTPLSGSVSRESFQISVPSELSGDEFPKGRASVVVEISGKHDGNCSS